MLWKRNTVVPGQMSCERARGNTGANFSGRSDRALHRGLRTIRVQAPSGDGTYTLEIPGDALLRAQSCRIVPRQEPKHSVRTDGRPSAKKSSRRNFLANPMQPGGREPEAALHRAPKILFPLPPQPTIILGLSLTVDDTRCAECRWRRRPGSSTRFPFPSGTLRNWSTRSSIPVRHPSCCDRACAHRTHAGGIVRDAHERISPSASWSSSPKASCLRQAIELGAGYLIGRSRARPEDGVGCNGRASTRPCRFR